MKGFVWEYERLRWICGRVCSKVNMRCTMPQIMEDAMQIKLTPITMENFDECLDLKVEDWQRDFVAPNANSIAEAYVDKMSIPLAIYADDTMVGFTMYGYVAQKQSGYILRLMIDSRYQKKGYGRRAMEIVLKKLKDAGCKRIVTSYHRNNTNAGALYEQLGFEKTGEFTDNGEIVCKLTVTS